MRNPIRSLYDWVLSWADKPGGAWALAAISFAESSFFPIPPDILLIPLCLSTPKKAFRLAALCTGASVLGGMLGYAIGVLLMDSVGGWIIAFYHLDGLFDTVTAAYTEWTAVAVIVAGFTPIPYKVFTIAAGMARVNFPVFVIASVVGRGGRFFLVAGLLWWFGEPMKDFIDRYFNLLTVAVMIVFIAGFAVIKLLFV